MYYIVILIIIILLIIKNKLKFNPDKHELSVNGPKPLPIIGNLHQASGDLPINIFSNLSLKYNHIFRFWMGDLYTVFISDPKLLREVFVDKFDIFLNRPINNKIQFGNKYHGTSMGLGDYWKNNRNLVQRALRKTNNKQLYDFVNEKVKDFKSMIEEKFSDSDNIGNDGLPYIILKKPRFYYQRFSMSLMFKLAYNENLTYDDYDEEKIKEVKFLIKKGKEVFDVFSNIHIIDFIKPLQPLYFKYLTYRYNTFPSYFNYVTNKYREHLKQIDFNQLDTFEAKDLMDQLIMEYGKDNPTESEMLSIQTTMLDFFMAGTDTTASTLEWITLKLINNQDLQEKLYQELKSLNKSIFKAQDKLDAPLLGSFIKEVSRLYPGVPFGLPHVAGEDVVIGDANNQYFIPKDSQILINFRGIAYNEDYFGKDAKQFKPDRFISPSKNENDAYMPFALGPRNCPGQLLAVEEIFSLASNLILNYKFDSIDGKPIPEIEKTSLTLNPKNFKKIKIIKRK